MVRLKKGRGKKGFQKRLHPTSQDIFKMTKKLSGALSEKGEPQRQVLQDWVQAEQIVKEQLKRIAQEKGETTP